MPSKVSLDALIQGIQFKDPRLYDALRGIIEELRRLGKDVIDLREPAGEIISDVFPPSIASFTYVIRDRSVHFDWTPPNTEVLNYELRKGTVWETAERLIVTSNLSADIPPLLEGTHTFLLKTINAFGNYSIDPMSLDVVIEGPGGVIINAQVIDNNVLLIWNEPPREFAISFYELKRNGFPVGEVSGTFTAFFEPVAGSYVYTVIPVDVAGNRGTESSVTAQVTQPPDFELSALFVSDLTGTRVNVAKSDDPKKLYAPANIVETYEQHFTNHSWTSVQDQLDAGYPYYLQPIFGAGTYTEVKDFGTVFNNVIVNLDWGFVYISGFVTVNATIAVSTDGITYSAPVVGVSSFFIAVRYVRLVLTFTPIDDKAFMELFNLRIILDVKREIDSGNVNALASDVDGTLVIFNKVFKDIDSLTVTPLSTTFATAIYDFVDAPNPTQFKVLVYDQYGNRINKLVSWKARGVV